jgi:hypothetical protein
VNVKIDFRNFYNLEEGRKQIVPSSEALKAMEFFSEFRPDFAAGKIIFLFSSKRFFIF